MRFAIPLLTMLLSGCALLNNDYKEPVSGETALVRFSSNGSLRLIPNRNCEDLSAPNAGFVLAHQTLGGPKYKGRTLGMLGEAPEGFTSAEVKVPGGQPLTVMFHSEIPESRMIYICQYSFVFLPKAGEQYQVTVRHDRAKNTCRWEPTSLLNPTQRVQVYQASACK